MPRRYGRAHEFFRWSLDSDEPINLAQARDKTAALAMQLRCGVAQLAHLSRGQNAARKSRRCGKEFGQSVQRGGTRVVAVVDYRKSLLKFHDLAALVRGLQSGEHALRFFRADAPN